MFCIASWILQSLVYTKAECEWFEWYCGVGWSCASGWFEVFRTQAEFAFGLEAVNWFEIKSGPRPDKLKQKSQPELLPNQNWFQQIPNRMQSDLRQIPNPESEQRRKVKPENNQRQKLKNLNHQNQMRTAKIKTTKLKKNRTLRSCHNEPRRILNRSSIRSSSSTDAYKGGPIRAKSIFSKGNID